MSTTIPNRSEVAREHQWDLSKLYPTDEAWEKDLKKLKNLEEPVAAYAGTLSQSADTLFQFMELWNQVGQLEERLGYYAMLRQSEDAGDSTNQARYSRYVQVASRVSSAGSFFSPELQQIAPETIDAWIQEDRFTDYRISLSRILRYRPHTLSPKEERLLAMQQEANQTASRTFGALIDVDMDFGTVETPEGPRALSQSSFGSLLEHTDRDVRQRAFEQFYTHFDHHKNTLASLYSGSVQLDIYRSRIRSFPSAVEASLFTDDVPVAVYDNLVTTVQENLPLLHRYYRLRNNVLGVSDPAIWDTKVALVPEIQVNNPYEAAVDTVVTSLAPLGDEYTTTLRNGLLGTWVDRYENKGKRSGAFSAGSYYGDPYILMNYKDDSMRDMFTLTHEAGHSMHSWYSVRSNPFQHYDYTIFEAEVASTFNEQLLVHHLLKEHRDGPMRAYLISKHIDDMVGTLFRQTMFAQFERIVHHQVETGNALTVDWFRSAYRELLEQYFGDTVMLPELLDLEGLRIPHFYRAFYVYKYATGISAAISLSRRVLEGETAERDAYFSFLRSGGSRFPIESLRMAGVDMAQPEPIHEAMAVFRTRVEQLEEALGQG